MGASGDSDYAATVSAGSTFFSLYPVAIRTLSADSADRLPIFRETSFASPRSPFILMIIASFQAHLHAARIARGVLA